MSDLQEIDEEIRDLEARLQVLHSQQDYLSREIRELQNKKQKKIVEAYDEQD